MPDERPILLCDVDGVLSLWGFDPLAPPPGIWAQVDGTAHYFALDAAHHLRELAAEHYELVWCTGWEERADEHLPHLLDVPAGRPHLVFDGRSQAEVSAHGHWKLPAIDAYVEERAVAWVDDALDAACRAWAARRSAPTLLVDTDPAIGLDVRSAGTLANFARAMLRP